MTHHIIFAGLLTLIGTVAQAQEPLSAEAFEAYTQGRTLTFSIGGENYGIEQYRTNRRVTWSFLDGRCEEGIWYEQDSSICFVYDFTTEVQCWQFFQEDDGLRAVFMDDPDSTVLYEAQESDEPMLCLGPEVGV